MVNFIENKLTNLVLYKHIKALRGHGEKYYFKDQSLIFELVNDDSLELCNRNFYNVLSYFYDMKDKEICECLLFLVNKHSDNKIKSIIIPFFGNYRYEMASNDFIKDKYKEMNIFEKVINKLFNI